MLLLVMVGTQITRKEINIEPRFRVIGSDIWSDEEGFAEATAASGITGICGSGIIEAVAELRIAGLMDENGLIGSAEATGTARSILEGPWLDEEIRSKVFFAESDVDDVEKAVGFLNGMELKTGLY